MSQLARFLAAFLAYLSIGAAPAHAQEAAPPAQVAWRLLDYLAVDYPGAVQDGRIVSASEYAEMVEFAGSVRERLLLLPPSTARADLIRDAEGLQAAINRRATPSEVGALARGLGSRLLATYPTPLAPSRVPDLARAGSLYREQCSACHGLTGRADGPSARGMNPAPIAFSDNERARDRSTFGLYQVITQGLDGTAMVSFSGLPSEDRWSLAFYVGQLSYTDAQEQAGERLWRSTPTLQARFSNLQSLTQTTPRALAGELGDERAEALTAYLRRHPDAVGHAVGGSLALVRERLAASVAAYVAGRRSQARDLALSAYLDGFEPVEPTLRSRDARLLVRVEEAMGALRSAISSGQSVAVVRERAAAIEQLVGDAEQALAPDRASAISTFLSAFTILLREGLEALLIVVAMIAFLRKAERQDVLPYVHGGWIAALLAGGLTWWAATYLVSISGASRELTEGFGGVISAAVLVSVGVWMHGKSQADAWQTYIRDRLSAALSKRSAWFLFLLAFLVVYREVFETVLFFAALWSQGGAVPMLGGAAAAVFALAILAWVLLLYSKRLPIAQFFRYSASLIAVLAVVLMGKGISALQEGGLVSLSAISAGPRIELLGVYPTIEGLLAQAATLAVLITGFWLSGRRAQPA